MKPRIGGRRARPRKEVSAIRGIKGNELLASFFFPTKQWELNREQRNLIGTLANRCKLGVALKGQLVGRVVGHADRRKSLKPDNLRLSRNRAKGVWWAFSNAINGVVDDPVDMAQFLIEARGDAECSKDPRCKGQAEESALARFRRADLFVALATKDAVENEFAKLGVWRNRLKELEGRIPELREEAKRHADSAAWEGSRKYEMEDTPTAKRMKAFKWFVEFVEALADGPPAPGESGRKTVEKLRTIEQFEKDAEKAEEALKAAESLRNQLKEAIEKHPLRSQEMTNQYNIQYLLPGKSLELPPPG
jgi:hypothetical protein